MANGKCGTCFAVLTEENSSPLRFKLGYGKCRTCDSDWHRLRRRGDFSYAPKREKDICSKCGQSLTKENCSSSVFKNGYGYCRSCNSIHRIADHNKNPEKFKYSILKTTAKKSGRTVAISFEEYSLLVKDKSCLYCGNSLSECIFGYGLDRVDNDKGYVSGNCVPCCWSCNMRKGRLEQLGFAPKRAIELLHEVNEIRRKESGHNAS